MLGNLLSRSSHALLWSPRRASSLTISSRALPSNSPLISIPDLSRCLQDVTLLDCRDYDSQYLAGHIPGAMSWSWPEEAPDLCQDASLEALVIQLETRGCSMDRPVVLCPTSASSASIDLALTTWLALLVLGHSEARILEGGFEAWESRGLETELYEGCPLKVAAIFERDPAAFERFLIPAAAYESTSTPVPAQLQAAALARDYFTTNLVTEPPSKAPPAVRCTVRERLRGELRLRLRLDRGSFEPAPEPGAELRARRAADGAAGAANSAAVFSAVPANAAAGEGSGSGVAVDLDLDVVMISRGDASWGAVARAVFALRLAGLDCKITA